MSETLADTPGVGNRSGANEGGGLSTFELFPGFRLTSEEALTYLDVYKQDFMPNYPFVIIPPTTDACTLYSESPSLFWVIMSAVAPQSPEVQQGVRKWLRQYISEHMIVQQERSLQLLQTLLLHLAWYAFPAALAEPTTYSRLGATTITTSTRMQQTLCSWPWP